MKPPLEVPADLRRLLQSRSSELVARVERFLAEAARRCTYLRTERVAGSPLRPSLLHRLLGHRPAAPLLPILDSKFGGVPYVEEANLPWEGFRFLGQINLAQIEDPPPLLHRHGLFALDVGTEGLSSGAFRVRWYPAPSEQHSRSSALPRCVGRWETRMRFSPGWSLPGGEAWNAPLPADDDELLRAWNGWRPEGFLEDEQHPAHRLLGHRSAGLDEPYGFEPPPGHGGAIGDYEMLWRITFDNPSGFHWGSNWLYVLVHHEDLVAGRLDRAVVTGANS